MEALVRNLPAFLRFLPVAALFHGQVINTAGLARGRLARRVLVYLGDRRLKTEDGIEVWPLGSFLTAVADKTLWP